MLLSEEDMQTLRDEHLLQPEDLVLDPRDRDSDEGVVGRSKRDNKRSTIEDQMLKFNSRQSQSTKQPRRTSCPSTWRTLRLKMIKLKTLLKRTSLAGQVTIRRLLHI